MLETITAIYENGVLRPLSPLSLNDGETVQIQLWSDDPKKQAELAIQFLVDRGLVTPLPNIPITSRLSLMKMCMNWLKG